MSQPHLPTEDHSIADTIQSLIIAFVLAMAFRGFILEGFVIPTGSMAPTLLGEHILWESRETGYTLPIEGGLIMHPNAPSGFRLTDPMLGFHPQSARRYVVEERDRSHMASRLRAGDRILVVKSFYRFRDPSRYDIMVFKNPTNPRENYIKRLIGLPNEEIWLADGNVFTRLAGSDPSAPFRIARKPVHVQRAVWQPLHNTDFRPIESNRLRDYAEPWIADDDWDLAHPRGYRYTGGNSTTLVWDNTRRPISDWNAYNMTSHDAPSFLLSDLRVAASVVPDTDGLATTLRLDTMRHVFEFVIDAENATVRMRPAESDPGTWTGVNSARHRGGFTPGRAMRIEFWHVDQRLSIWMNGREVVSLDYDWSARERIENATGRSIDEITATGNVSNPFILLPNRPRESSMTWSFRGSPVTLERVRVDRDLYYQPTELEPGNRRQQPHDPVFDGPGRATHPDATLTLGADHFFMCGDNSASSLDGRMWGSPHPLVASQIDDAPFVVHRRLLIGKAWTVYFPAPYPLTEGGRSFIPDFGRLRFIR